MIALLRPRGGLHLGLLPGPVLVALLVLLAVALFFAWRNARR